MKIFTFLATIIAFVVTGNVFAQEITLNYHFDKPAIITDDKGYAELKFKDCYNYGEEGYPLLSYYGADILLNQGHEISSIEILSTTYSKEIFNVKIKPASKQFPISKGPQNGYEVEPNEDVYSLTGTYPTKIIENSNTGFLAGHSIGSFSVCPVKYYPSESKVQFLEDISIRITTKETVKALDASTFLKHSSLTDQRIGKIVENISLQSKYTYPSSKNEEIDILLITKNSLIPAFEEYISFKESTGFIVSTISTEDIYDQYTGQDEQDQIRNCIIDYYENYNLEFVILGGDSDPSNSSQDIIPHRGFFAIDDNDIPSDMYYCCLDGNWNDDGDNKWGEPGEYDLYAEVGIGRICVDNSSEIQNFTSKLIMYQDQPVVADIEKALMIGEELNNSPWTYGGDYKDEIVEGTSNYGMNTAGITDNFNIEYLYDRDMNWNKYDVFDMFNNTGVNLLNHLGHSSPTYNMKMNNSDITTSNFQNDGVTRGFAIGYSQGCYNGSFDNRDWDYNYGQDCFAEKITTLSTAEVATVANSRYGWYSPGATSSSSQYCDRQFFDAIFGEEITIIGYANSDSREDLSSNFASSEYMRWTVYELNLFGDPSMDIWTAVPTEIVANYIPSLIIGSVEFEVQTDAPFARIGLMQNDLLIGRGVADESGFATIEFIEPVTNSDLVEISIIAHNKNRHTGTLVIVSNQPYVLFDSFEINDASGNENGLIDFGEQIDLGLGVKNVGDQAASNVIVNLSTDCEYITITDNSETYGNFDAGETIFLEDVFAFTVAEDIPNNCVVSFIVEATGDSTWNSNFSTTACAPELVFGDFSISDSEGNNNGRLDPGETAYLIINVQNTGNSNALETMAELLDFSGAVTINNFTYDLGGLESNESDEAIFSITVDPDAPIGSFAQFSFEMTSGYYIAQENYATKIGLIVEDWESGNFGQYVWETGGNAEWEITSNNPYEGTYCAKSGDISDNQFTILMLDYEAMYNDSISFYVKVSSEEGYDYLFFEIDNETVGQWAGNVPWQRVSYAISAGDHNFKWYYDKDTYVSSGQDCAWIDFIELPTPLTTTANAGMDDIICEGSTFHCSATATNYNSIEWTTSGTGNFYNPASLSTDYIPSIEDINMGSVILTLTVEGPGETISDDLLLNINLSPEINFTGNFEMCSNDGYYFENIIAENYSTLSWTTSGDGEFDDNNLLATTYIPGSNDVVNGLVTLSLTATAMDPCEDKTSDFVFAINASPVVELGIDTSICQSQSIILDAGNEGAIYLWSTNETTQTIEASSGGIVDILTYWVEVTNDYGCMTSNDISISFEECAGINDNNIARNVQIFPNPNSGSFNIEFKQTIEEELNIYLFNALNEIVYQELIFQKTPSFSHRIEISDLQKGIYFLKIEGKSNSIIKKLIVQ